MKTIDKDTPVLVTGATGYVAGWIVKRLLDEGLTVHAAVRDPENTKKLAYLNQLAENAKGTIKYFKADLLQDGTYAEAMEGCELVYHTASPFTTNVKNPQSELIDPALKGTRNVLQQANKTLSVKRVVLTSSVAAIYSDNADLENTPDGKFTEDVWNTTSSLTHQPYSYSKTLAEKEAWKICKDQDRWDLVVINPSLVLGPAINPSAVSSESFNIIKSFGNGDMRFGVPKMGFGVVDVRDVAEAHFYAGFTPDAKGRHIVSGYNLWFLDMAKALAPKFGDTFPIPKKEMPGWLIRMVGPMVNKAMTREYLKRNLGLPFVADNSKSIDALGLTYHPMKETINAMFEQMVEVGIFSKN